jgi:hypothetical protein
MRIDLVARKDRRPEICSLGSSAITVSYPATFIEPRFVCKAKNPANIEKSERVFLRLVEPENTILPGPTNFTIPSNQVHRWGSGHGGTSP